jgi:hypothetical protein
MDSMRESGPVSRSSSCSLIAYTMINRRFTYSWEFITNLDYEWDIIRGHRTHSWTIWVCSDTRIFGSFCPAWNARLIRPLVDLLLYPAGYFYNCNT